MHSVDGKRERNAMPVRKKSCFLWRGASVWTIPLLLLMVTVILLVTVTGCTDGSGEPIRIGVNLPLTGEYQAYGTQGLHGLQLAAQEINRDGGILGRPVELVVEDNATDPNVAVRKARKLIQEDGVSAIVGPVSSTARDAVLEVCRQFRVPLLYGIGYEGGAYDRYLFCYSPIPAHTITPLVPYMMEDGSSKFYIYGYDYVWPHSMADAIEKTVAEAGGTIVGKEFAPFGLADYSGIIGRIRDSGADNLMLIMPGPDGYRFLEAFQTAGVRQRVRVAAIAADEAYLGAVSEEALEGVLTAVPFAASLDKPEAQAFVRRQQELFGAGSGVTYSTESHYGLLMLFRTAVTNAGGLEDEAWMDAMTDLQITVGNGPVRMRADHHMDLNMLICTYRQGTLAVGKDIGTVTPPDQRELP